MTENINNQTKLLLQFLIDFIHYVTNVFDFLLKSSSGEIDSKSTKSDINTNGWVIRPLVEDFKIKLKTFVT